MVTTVSFFHGAALIKIIRHELYDSIRVYTENDCSYIVNGNVGLYIKYSRKRLSPWNFTFSEGHVHDITDMKGGVGKAYIALACNDDGICCLSWQEFATVISTEGSTYPKRISVSRMQGEKYSVWGSDGKLNHKIGNNDFPRKIFMRAHTTDRKE